MKSMTSEAYINIFNSIKKITGVHIEIHSMNCDMEGALTNAIKTWAPSANINFCKTHVIRKLYDKKH